MKRIIENIIKRKNKDFKFDEIITTRIIFLLFLDKGFYFLRGLVFNIVRFKKPTVIFIGKNVKTFNSKNIQFSSWVRIENNVYLSGLGKGKLQIGRSSSIGAYSQLVISTSFNRIGEFIKIGNNVGIGQFASIGGSGGVTIEDDCIIGQYLSCHPENHNFQNINMLIRSQGTTRNEIKIGKNCWIGAKVTILAGVEIGEGCIVAAGSVVTKSMPPFSIIGGVPARVIKFRDNLND